MDREREAVPVFSAVYSAFRVSPLSLFMRHITFDINTKWAMNYAAYKRAKGKRRDKIRAALFSLLQHHGEVVRFNHENA